MSAGRLLAVWGIGALLSGPASFVLAARTIHTSPVGIEGPPTPGPSGAAVVFVLVPLLVLWTTAVAAVAVARITRASSSPVRVRLGVGALVCLAPAIVMVSGWTLHQAATPGCGDPRAGFTAPFPEGTEIVGHSVSGPISGPEMWRIDLARSSEMSLDELWSEVVERNRARGWRLETDPADVMAVAEADHGDWELRITIGDDDFVGGPGEAVGVELSHTPYGHAASCLKW